MIIGEAKFEETVEWLLERESPGVRYLAMRDLEELPSDDPRLLEAKELAHHQGPIAKILDNMEPEGFWVKSGPGYLPKYRSNVWSITMLAQIGASASEDERIGLACGYLLEHTLTPGGHFSSSGTPGGTVDCLQGNLCWSLVQLGYDDPRLDSAFDWMARSVTGEGVAPMTEKKAPVRYYAGKYGPDFLCGANNKLACAWGAAKVMLAFGILPEDRKTTQIGNAIERGVEFLFSVDPATAEYPTGYAKKPSRNWWKFGFPVFYITDLLQIVEGLVLLGYGRDPRLKNAIDLIIDKRDDSGRWALEYSYKGKSWLDFGELKKPNKWVTLRAMRVLKELDS
jgi:hypothetical protein